MMKKINKNKLVALKGSVPDHIEAQYLQEDFDSSYRSGAEIARSCCKLLGTQQTDKDTPERKVLIRGPRR